jgi:transposase
VKPIPLDAVEQEALREIIKKGTDWRERDRAATILLLAAGQSVREVAAQQGCCEETVRIRRRNWLKSRFASLSDQPRCGAPSKLAEEHRQRLRAWVAAEPLSARELITRLERECGVTLGATTLRNELARMGYVWKRTRYSLKKSVIRSASPAPQVRSPTCSSRRKRGRLNWRMSMNPGLRRSRRTARDGRNGAKPMRWKRSGLSA